MNRLSALMVGVVVFSIPTFGIAAPDRTRPKLRTIPINRVLVLRSHAESEFIIFERNKRRKQ